MFDCLGLRYMAATYTLSFCQGRMGHHSIQTEVLISLATTEQNEKQPNPTLPFSLKLFRLYMTSCLSDPLSTSHVSSKCLLSPMSCWAYCCQRALARVCVVKGDWENKHVSCLKERCSSPLDLVMLSSHCSCQSNIIMVTSIRERKGKEW